MTTYLEIAVNVPQVSGIFHYHLPPELEGEVQIGQLLLVPFGKQTVQGVALRFIEQPEIQETRAVLQVVDPDIRITPYQIALASAMSDTWLSSLAACIGLMLPAGVDQQADQLYTVQGEQPTNLTKSQERLYSLLSKRGALNGQQIDRAMPRINWRTSARALIRRGLMQTTLVAPEVRVRPKFVRTVRLSKPMKFISADELLKTRLGKPGSTAEKRRRAMVQFLLAEGGEAEAPWVYAMSAGNLNDLRALEKLGVVELGETESWRDPLAHANYPLYETPELTKDQKKVWVEIEQQLFTARTKGTGSIILLHGVTGSGKTEIYLRAVNETLKAGLQAIVLVPEIALTPQTIQRFAGRFPGKVGVLHSGLSQGERYDTWRRARSGELSLVVGPRSALFTPFSNPGLIVIDECHDDSYYQSEGTPYYHAREAAVDYAKIVGAVCLMGSATPDVASTFEAERGKWLHLKLPERILAHRSAVAAQLEQMNAYPDSHSSKLQSENNKEGANASELPPVSVIDMRDELKAGNRSIFSRAMQASLSRVLRRGEQAILFLNRRGSATYVFCRDCGYTLKCPKCDIPLTFHEGVMQLICHYCGYRRLMPKVCPKCGSERIRQYGTGTQKVETELREMFPQARTLRWDHETTRRKGAHEAILHRFSTQQANVLIGTQMLAKGMDLPMVTLVGVVLADVGLTLPDYRANERTFQVITQVAGRAGRSPLGGEVILQTFQPDHYVIQTAAQHNYNSFYKQELEFRQQLRYPPFNKLVRMEYRHLDPGKAEAAASKLGNQVRYWLIEGGWRATRMIGPAPCFFSRVSGYYRWQIVLCGPDPVSILRGRLLGDWKVEVNPPNLL